MLFGAGATGARIARQLHTSGAVGRLDICDPDDGKAAQLASALGNGSGNGVGDDAGTVSGDSLGNGAGGGSEAGEGSGSGDAADSGADRGSGGRAADVRVTRIADGAARRLDADVSAVVVASPAGSQAALARRALDAGVMVVATSNHVGEVRRLLSLDDRARQLGAAVVVGAGFMPGLTCLLARHGAAEFDQVEEIHVAKVGTGGPACARQHHRALSTTAVDWRDGTWRRRAGGSGRELAWFPDPIGGRDCYRASLPDALLLMPHFDGVQRITARQGATRRDRLTAPLPMLRPPHSEGGIGGVRVELRGRVGSERRVVVFGAVGRPAVAAGAVAATALAHLLASEPAAGAYGLAGIGDTAGLLGALGERGLRPQRFEGMATFT